jgi:uncharacterized protein (TIGR02996 family)
MTEREALFRAVCENPDDDTARLVFADWLQEHGEEERAEFIRLQCRRDRGMASTRTEFAHELQREFGLWNTHKDRWLAELPTNDNPELVWERPFVRGFPDETLCVEAKRATRNTGNYSREVVACSSLSWELLYYSTPFTVLKFFSVSGWQTPLDLPESARIKRVVLNDCRVDQASVESLISWGRSGTGHLRISQGQFDASCYAILGEVFGSRFERDLRYR